MEFGAWCVQEEAQEEFLEARCEQGAADAREGGCLLQLDAFFACANDAMDDIEAVGCAQNGTTDIDQVLGPCGELLAEYASCMGFT